MNSLLYEILYVNKGAALSDSLIAEAKFPLMAAERIRLDAPYFPRFVAQRSGLTISKEKQIARRVDLNLELKRLRSDQDVIRDRL